MEKREWLLNAAYLIHVRAPTISSDHADDLADDLYGTCAELEPDEAVTMYFFAMGDGWNGCGGLSNERLAQFNFGRGD